MLKVVSPATNLALLSIERLRAVAGLAADDASQDGSLERLGARASAEICQACRLAVGAGAEPTLRRETFEQTFWRVNTSALILARRHQVDVASVSVNDQIFADDRYWVDPESGIVRLVSGCWWAASRIVVTYDAGFDDVPEDLAGAAEDLVRISLSEVSRDPLVRGSSVEVPGVLSERTDYWVGGMPSKDRGPVPSSISRRLTRYLNVRSW